VARRYAYDFHCIAQRYNTNWQRPPQLLIKPKQKCIKTPKNCF
jgi:hypothetical protein